MSIEDFMRNEKPKSSSPGRKSRLGVHAEQIMQLNGRGYQVPQILRYLEQEHGIKVSESYMHRYIANQKAKRKARLLANALNSAN